MNGKPLTKKQKEAKERREQKEAEFCLMCSIIDEIKEYPVLYDKAHPSHYKKNSKQAAETRQIFAKEWVEYPLVFWLSKHRYC